MKLKQKIILLAVVPLVTSLALIAFGVLHQQRELARGHRELVKSAFMRGTEDELRHYVALALSTISPLYNTQRDDEEIKRLAMKQLEALDYGPDGYFFLYDFDGINLMHPRQPELIGKNLLRLTDSTGQHPIQMMIDLARTGGGFVSYTWNKPSTKQVEPKLAYVTSLARWNWMIGTGVYIDDIDAVLAQLDRELSDSVSETLLGIAGIALFAVTLIFASVLFIGVSELKIADAKLTLLTRKVVSSQEDERAHLSRELHDSVSQMLVSVKLLVESALDRLPDPAAAVRPVLTKALARLHDALAELRGMSHRLRPPMLDALGLPAALQNLGEEMCAQPPVKFVMKMEGEAVDLPDEIKTVLFRVTQEALTNVRKHAGAGQVEMHLVHNADRLTLSIEDNGCGFDSDAETHHPRRGIGLRNMRERLDAIGGTLEIHSRPGGTRVTVTVPEAAIRRFRSMEALHG